ncbi:hypothetical protein Lepto7376_1898 [[Leptolyngbya] sp. PCC 7376]|nr:hypothetical protein Lepto7376_1898 [[Leptolyngbya] sp. PCC 7376]
MDAAADCTPVNVKPAHTVNLKTYTARWSGADLGNGVTVTAKIMLDLNLISSPGIIGSAIGAGAAFKSIDIEVTGATNSNANGRFTADDFGRAVLRFLGPVDLTKELVGQAGFSGITSEFNVFRSVSNPLAPTAISFNKLRVFGEEEAVLTSFAPTMVEDVTPTQAVNFPMLLDMGNMALYCR